MLHRARSKDRSSVPGPTFMTSRQMGDYLQDLRSNPVQRPTGARPPPSSFIRRQSTPTMAPDSNDESSSRPTLTQSQTEPAPVPPRCSSVQSHRRTNSGMSNMSAATSSSGRPLVSSPLASNVSVDSEGNPTTPPLEYRESGHRWMERLEAHSIRRAMEDMDLKDEARLHSAAQDEASELVWKHQNPNAPFQNPGAPYKYKEHLRKGSHSRSQSLGPSVQDTQRKSSGGSGIGLNGSRPQYASSGSQRDRIPSNGSGQDSKADTKTNPAGGEAEKKGGDAMPRKKSYGEMAVSAVAQTIQKRRTSSGSKRKASGSKPRALFDNPGDKIFEEPEELPNPPKAPAADPVPLRERRNPFARVKFANDSLPRSNSAPMFSTKPFNRIEIHRNPPSQSRNPDYTSNKLPPQPAKEGGEDTENVTTDENVKMKDGKEIRGDDLRAATSMKLSDRSPKLPTPTMVSDSPGRPIVSFQKDYKPKAIELKEENSRSIPGDAPPRASIPGETKKPANPDSRGSDVAASAFPFPPMHRSKQSLPTIGESPIVNKTVTTKPAPKQPIPTIRADSATSNPKSPTPPSIPAINVPDEPKRPAVPTISLPDSPTIPSIQVDASPAVPQISAQSAPLRPAPSIQVNSAPAVPTIAVNDTPSISVSGPPIPTISVSEPPSISVNGTPSAAPSRPLPVPSKKSPFTRPMPKPGTTPHWTPSTHRNTALCSTCALPIAGRIVSAAGCRFHPECFRCHHCSEGLECVAFYPEPDAKRSERVDRIQRRMNGEDVTGEDVPGEEEDGDEGLRFYCHLDFHEMFSPRCKSCKTPIEGEVVVACGAEWHVGHFFCAQCGDPFDSTTPFVEKDGFAWCVNCHTNRYSTKCKKCRKPVTDTVLKALGAEWHQNCFCCTECGGPFEDGRYFLRQGGQDPVCVACEEKRLKA